MSGWVSDMVLFSDFGDSYRIYRACELVLVRPLKRGFAYKDVIEQKTKASRWNENELKPKQ